MFTIYTKPSCPFCDKAKALLNSKGLPYTEIIIGTDIVREEVVEMFPAQRTVPIIVEDGGVIGGYTQLTEHLASRGPEATLILG